MPVIQEDSDREHRIMMEIIVEAYGSEEKAMGWYYPTFRTYKLREMGISHKQGEWTQKRN